MNSFSFNKTNKRLYLKPYTVLTNYIILRINKNSVDNLSKPYAPGPNTTECEAIIILKNTYLSNLSNGIAHKVSVYQQSVVYSKNTDHSNIKLFAAILE